MNEIIEKLLSLTGGQFEIVLDLRTKDDVIAFKNGVVSLNQIKTISYKAT